MSWIHLVILLAVVQIIYFAMMVSKARETYGVKAPAISGNENFERCYRVQMNSIELFVAFVPAIILASQYWSPYLMAVLGLIYLVGRILYSMAYTSGKKRTIPFLMSFAPVCIYIILGLIGTIRALISGV